MSTDNTTLRIHGPVDLLTGIPYLLGFHPQQSLILVGLTHGVLVVTARIDLAELDEHADDDHSDGALTSTLEAMTRGGCTQFVGAIFTDTAHGEVRALPYAGLVERLAAQIDEVGGQLLDCLLVANGTWWSYQCTDPRCCPAAGRPLPDAPTQFEAAATFAGLTAAPTREQLEARFDPHPDRELLRPMVERSEAAFDPVIVDGKFGLHGRIAVRAINLALEFVGGDFEPFDDVDVARMGAWLRHNAIRDAAWIVVDRNANADSLLLDLARRLPSPYDAAPLFLYGWSMWRRGNGTLAGMAAQRALASDCGYTAARLLMTAVERGFDPRGG